MTEFKRNYPQRGRRAVKGFFFHAAALNLSLEATGLAAHIFSFADDDVDEEVLKSMFPDRDLTGPLKELASIGLIEFIDPASDPAPAVDIQDVPLVRRAAGTIYLVEGSGFFKIGVTQSVRARLSSLQTGSPVALRMVRHVFVQDCVEAERLAHGLLARFRMHGEWFRCTEEKAIAALETAAEAVGQEEIKKQP